jgi:hypothetical protein
MKDSLLMCDNTEGDGKAEIVMDYVMSYSLRHAEDKYLKEKPILCQYCRYMLGILLGVEISKATNIKSVKVWKEWRYIDLCVEVVIVDGETEQKYALLIENKYYTLLHDNQLSRYKEIFDEYYDPKEWNRLYKLVTCHEKEDIQRLYGKELLNSPAFIALNFYELLPDECLLKDKDTYQDTESDIFNEFWLRKW